MKTGGDFLPAIDTLLRLRRSGANDHSVVLLVNRALDVAPGRYALLLGLEALDPSWGGSLAEIAGLCAGAASKIPDYSEDLCMIDTVFWLDLYGNLRFAALKLLEKHDEEFLGYARLDAYLNEWGDRPEAAREAMRIVRAQGGDTNAFTLSVIATQFGQTDFYDEMMVKAEQAQRVRLLHSPQDSNALLSLAEDLLQKDMRGDLQAAPAELLDLWRETLELSAYRGDVWLLGSHFDSAVNGFWDFERRKPFFENAVYYSNYRPWAFSEYMVFLGQLHDIATNPMIRLPDGIEFDDEKVGAATSCELVRALRFFQQACEIDPRDRGGRTFGVVEVAIEKANKLMTQDSCEKERTAPLEDLAYKPVPVAHFTAVAGK